MSEPGDLSQASPGPAGPRVRSVRRFAERPRGPLLLALGLSLLSAPIVAWALTIEPGPLNSHGWEQPALGQAVVVALVAVVMAGLVGGGIGGLVVREHPTTGALVAIALAWPVALSTLPIIATVVGARVQQAYICRESACGFAIDYANPLSGVGAYALSVAMSAVLGVPALLAVGCLVGSWVMVRRADGGIASAALVVVAYACLHLPWVVIVVFAGSAVGLVAFACLAVGVVVWVALTRPVAPAVPTGPRPDAGVPGDGPVAPADGGEPV